MLSNAVVVDEYRAGLKNELLDLLSKVSSKAKFEDMTWFFDNLTLSAGIDEESYKVRFSNIDKRYLKLTKWWVLIRIKNLIAVSGLASNVSYLKRLFRFLSEEFGLIPLSDVNRLMIEYWQESLAADRSIEKSTKENAWGSAIVFFRDMKSWSGMPVEQVFPPGNPFQRKELDRKNEERLVPDSILEQFDKIFLKEEVPIETRCIYWILRLIPSRITELTTMPIECLEPYGNDWVLKLCDKKQSGSPYYHKNRMVYLKYEGKGKLLIDLIREQKVLALSFQDYLPKEKQGFLFTCSRRSLYILKAPNMEMLKSIKPCDATMIESLKYCRGGYLDILRLLWYEAYVRKLAKTTLFFPLEVTEEIFDKPISRVMLRNRHIRECYNPQKPLKTILSDIEKYIDNHIPKVDTIVWKTSEAEKNIKIMDGRYVRRRFKRIEKVYDVKMPDGTIFGIITHCFRHNGITERLYAGFSYVEIRDMTGHEGNQMIAQSYSHVKDEEIIKIARRKRKEGEGAPPVLFKGKIMNLDPKRVERLLKRPRAYRIGDLGICSDITSCKDDLFECLDCDDLIPDADNPEYYEKEVERWNGRLKIHRKNGNKSLAEHAEYMATLHSKQLVRMKVGLAMAEMEAENAN